MASAATSTPTPTSPPPPPPPPPPPAAENRARPRRRAREVSSRYMTTPSPSSSSSSSHGGGETHLASSPRMPFPVPALPPHPLLSLPKKPPNHAATADPEPARSFADENRPAPASVRRGLETPLSTGIHSKPVGTQRKRAVVRLFGENGGEKSDLAELAKPAESKRRPRPGTPITLHSIDRSSSSCSTPRSESLSQNLMRLTSAGTARRAISRPPTAARASSSQKEGCAGHSVEEAFSESSSALADLSDAETCSVSSQCGLCDSPPLLPAPSRLSSDLRSSMPEADLLPTMSAKRVFDGREDPSCRSSNPLCYRSLNSALSNCQPIKNGGKPPLVSKPPQPPISKLAVDVKKGKKGSGRQEDAHVLRLLDNCYVQWRLTNAKAQAAAKARSLTAEKSLFGLSAKISELQNSVVEKRTELEQWRRRERLYSILEPQMPYLDEWAILEEDHTSSLTAATTALQDASLRLPIDGDMRVEITELKEVLDSAVQMLESLSPNVQSFLPKAEGIEDIATDLAKVVSSERSLIEECGNLLSEAHNLQVKDSSLRSQLMQLRQMRAL
ncbi:protein ENDOSPERM DEFECTIVE 1-like [Ananas comosus]|uniref:Protein ENDOSPERM DEFECTIVE 1 n=1 Tax=Ananas comosus TaxID=4615 RepID=A0A199UVG9_ANACO|nr:protein ENDOSPERM DEFECTIVE 1-like [Ananas comosus]OAY68749.1 Protein ENDOSPERM DEFECTIVE 1 [Ananas comosus]